MRSRIPFSPRNWKRKNFDDSYNPIRSLAENETDHDLQKTPQQILCDVHEEVLEVLPYWDKIREGKRLNHAERFNCYSALINSQKRMASLQTKNAINSGRIAFWAMIFAFIALIFSGASLYIQIYNHKDSEHAEPHQSVTNFGKQREHLPAEKDSLKHLAPPE